MADEPGDLLDLNPPAELQNHVIMQRMRGTAGTLIGRRQQLLSLFDRQRLRRPALMTGRRPDQGATFRPTRSSPSACRTARTRQLCVITSDRVGN
jgi:hypothetical protein